MLLYIDPGSSSLLVQFLIGAFLAVGFFFKSLKQRILSFFRRKPHDDAQS
jgi:hypothetical protein